MRSHPLFALGIVACVLALATSAAVRQAKCSSGELREIQAELRTADQALARSDYRRANYSAATAILKIGDRYTDPGMIDDTGLRLSLADWQERQGNLKQAAIIRVRMARTRLNALARKSGC